MYFRDQASFTLLKTQTKNKHFFSPNPPKKYGQLLTIFAWRLSTTNFSSQNAPFKTSVSPGIQCEGSVFAGASWPSFRPQRGSRLTLLPVTGSSRDFASRRSGGRGADFLPNNVDAFKGEHMVVDAPYVYIYEWLKYIYIYIESLGWSF